MFKGIRVAYQQPTSSVYPCNYCTETKDITNTVVAPVVLDSHVRILKTRICHTCVNEHDDGILFLEVPGGDVSMIGITTKELIERHRN